MDTVEYRGSSGLRIVGDVEGPPDGRVVSLVHSDLVSDQTVAELGAAGPPTDAVTRFPGRHVDRA